MKRETKANALLEDVFAEATLASSREAMLGQSVRVARRRHLFRQSQRVAVVCLTFGLAAGLLWQHHPRHSKVLLKAATEPVAKAYHLVLSQSLSASVMVTTQPMKKEQFIPETALVQIVQTTRHNYRLINDQELLALISPRPCALVQTGPKSEKLVFVNPEDAKGFPIN